MGKDMVENIPNETLPAYQDIHQFKRGRGFNPTGVALPVLQYEYLKIRGFTHLNGLPIHSTAGSNHIIF